MLTFIFSGHYFLSSSVPLSLHLYQFRLASRESMLFFVSGLTPGGLTYATPPAPNPILCFPPMLTSFRTASLLRESQPTFRLVPLFWSLISIFHSTISSRFLLSLPSYPCLFYCYPYPSITHVVQLRSFEGKSVNTYKTEHRCVLSGEESAFLVVDVLGPTFPFLKTNSKNTTY